MQTSPKRRRLGSPSQPHLDDEIALIRALIDRLAREAAGSDDLPDLTRALNAVSAAGARLAVLLKTNRALAEDQDLAIALQTAISEAAEELRHKALQEP